MTETVKVGSLSCKLWKCVSGEWRWNYYAAGKRKQGSARDIEKAKEKARNHLILMRDGRSGLSLLSPKDIADFLRWQKLKKGSLSTGEAVAKYLSELKSTGPSHIYFRKCRTDLESFANAHNGEIAGIIPEQIDEWLAGLNVGPRRANNLRATLVSLFRWARRRGYVADETTAPEKVSRRKIRIERVEVFTPEQLRTLLDICGHEWRAAIAIQAFAGIRTAEVSRLTWGNVMLAKGIIEVPASASKVGKRRLVPILDNLAGFLSSPKRSHIPITPAEGHQIFIERIRRQFKFPWITNGLRHSFGSYRCAILKDIAQVAFEMGNSPAMVNRHYNEAQELSAALDWFSIESKTNQSKSGKAA